MTQLIDSVSPPGSPPTDKLSVLRPFCLLCTAALLCSCSSGLGRLHGKIIDAGDAAPPPDVIVVAARWLVDDLPMPRVHRLCAWIWSSRAPMHRAGFTSSPSHCRPGLCGNESFSMTPGLL